MADRPGAPATLGWSRPAALGALLAALAGAAPALAQPAPAPTGATAPAAPKPIPGAEVADHAQEDLDLVRELRAGAQPDPRAEEIRAQLAASEDEVSSLATRFGGSLAGAPTRRAIDRAAFDFQRLRDRLDDWSAPLGDRAEALDASLERLEERRAVWLATREKAAEAKQPRAVTERVDSVLAEIDAAEKAVRARRNTLLTIRESVARQQSQVASMLDLVREKRSALRRSFFERDAPPLWSAVAEEGEDQGLLERMAAAREHDLEDVAVFRREGRLLAVLALGAIGIAIAFALRGPARRLAADDETLLALAQLLHRPVAAGIVASFLLAPLIIANAPPVVLGLYGFALITASLRLLAPLVDPALRRILYGLSIWYAVDRLRDRLVPDELGSRLLVLAGACVALAVLAWLLRPARIGALAQLAHGRGWLRVIGFGMRVAFVLCATAILCGVIGNTSLSEVLVEGTVASAWSALGMLALFRVLGGLWALLLRSGPARALRMVRDHEALLRRRGRSLIQATLVACWVALALSSFYLGPPAREALAAALAAQGSIGELRISLGGIAAFVLMVVGSVLLSRFVRFALEEDVLTRASLPRGVPFAISTLAGYAILLAGFAMAVAAAGLELSRLALVFGALGVGVGIGLQDVVNNFVSGLILIFEGPVQVGDLVDVGTVRGEVRRIGIRSSTVRTFDGAEVVIPNSKLASETFVNWTLSDRLTRIEIQVGVAYGSDTDRVLEILDSTVRSRPEVLRHPPPQVLFDRLGESSLDFRVRAWAADFDTTLQLRSRLTADILRALTQAGISIPFPQRDLHLRSLDPAALAGLRGSDRGDPRDPDRAREEPADPAAPRPPG